MRWITLFALLSALVLAAPASAQTEPGEYAEFGVADTTARPPTTATPLDEGTDLDYATGAKKYSRHFYVRYKSLAGLTLWQYNCQWIWYAKKKNGKLIISKATHWEWPSYTAPGWSYEGTKYLQKYGAVGTDTVGRRVQGHFVFSIPAIGAVRHKWPWIDVKVTAQGNHWVQWDDG